MAVQNGFDLRLNIRMHVSKIRLPRKRRDRMISSGKENRASSHGMQTHSREDRLESSIERGGKKIVAFLQLPEAVDNQGASWTKNLADRSKRFAGQQV